MAEKIKKIHPRWNDDQIFNEARKWVIATYQVKMTSPILHYLSYPGELSKVLQQTNHAQVKTIYVDYHPSYCDHKTNEYYEYTGDRL